MSPLNPSTSGGNGPLTKARPALEVLEALLAGRRELLLHDAWTTRAIFASREGPWRRAGFAQRVLQRAIEAERERRGAASSDPLEEAFWLLTAQAGLLNHRKVEARAIRVLFGELRRLRPSQQRSIRRLLSLRSEQRLHADGGPASNLILLAITAGSLAAVRGRDAVVGEGAELGGPHATSRFGELPLDRVEVLVLPPEIRERLDQEALAHDLARRSRDRIV